MNRVCPICMSRDTDLLVALNIEDFDHVSLDRQVTIVTCKKCGFAFNDVSVSTMELEQFYRNETLYSSDVGVGSGGNSDWDIDRYSAYLNLLSPYLKTRKAAIADIGCAKGGFLHFLSQRGYTNLLGVDINPECVKLANQWLNVRAKNGSLFQLPFDDHQIDALVYSHVLEHADNLYQCLNEMQRVLKDNGLVFIEVPDAGRYDAQPVFDFYWFSLREHINHFNAMHLEMLMHAMGFESVVQKEMFTDTSDTSQYPSVLAIFRKTMHPPKKAPQFNDQLRQTLERYVQQETDRFDSHRGLIHKLAENQAPLFIWGIGLEFFFIYGMTLLKNCNIQQLIDKNPKKQKHTVSGWPISDPDCLRGISPDSTVFITSVLHKHAMVNYLKESGYSGNVVSLS